MLDMFHARIHASALLQRFTAVTRLLLAAGFFAPGIVKLLGYRFTQLGTDDPVGYFFDAFFQAEAFYMFVGLAQVGAALLLLWPRTATLGAVLYAPIIANITIVTWSIGFGGTRWITVLMSLACAWLLVWDWNRLRAILPRREASGGGGGARTYAVQAGLWAGAGVAAGIVGAAFGALPSAPLPVIPSLGVMGALFGLVLAWHVQQMPAG